MMQFLLKRLGLTLLTLFLLSVLIFVAANLLPGDVGRAILGPLADQQSVDDLNRQYGLDRPLMVRYADWIWSFVQGDLGISYRYRAPAAPFVGEALVRSALLAAIAFLMVVPLGILGGVYAALKVNRPADRIITLVGLSATVVPEFVSGIILIVVLALWLDWLPLGASVADDASFGTQLYHLILPALPLVLVLFGYIARMARAGTIQALRSDYTRTAVLKGLTWPVVIRRHVLRNALLPTITVVATQVGYLFGGLVAVEFLFNYHGMGRLIYTAARGRDYLLLQSSVLVVGLVFALATLAADLLQAWLDPRLRARSAR